MLGLTLCRGGRRRKLTGVSARRVSRLGTTGAPRVMDSSRSVGHERRRGGPGTRPTSHDLRRSGRLRRDARPRGGWSSCHAAGGSARPAGSRSPAPSRRASPAVTVTEAGSRAGIAGPLGVGSVGWFLRTGMSGSRVVTAMVLRPAHRRVAAVPLPVGASPWPVEVRACEVGHSTAPYDSQHVGRQGHGPIPKVECRRLRAPAGMTQVAYGDRRPGKRLAAGLRRSRRNGARCAHRRRGTCSTLTARRDRWAQPATTLPNDRATSRSGRMPD